MAVLKNIVLAATLLTPFALAAPMLEERAIYTYTETEIAWVTVEETVTVWVDPGAPTPAPAATSSTTTGSVPPAVLAETTYTPSTLASVAAAPSVAAPSSSWSSPSPAASPSSGPAAINVQPKDVTGSTTGTCEDENDACVGDVTHWDGGLGACGWNVDTDSDMQIALPYAFMGTQSNGNPYCGRAVTLYNPNSGTTVSATVGDKCMGCDDRSIDCTDVLFNAITDGEGNGRMSGIEWWFT